MGLPGVECRLPGQIHRRRATIGAQRTWRLSIRRLATLARIVATQDARQGDEGVEEQRAGPRLVAAGSMRHGLMPKRGAPTLLYNCISALLIECNVNVKWGRVAFGAGAYALADQGTKRLGGWIESPRCWLWLVREADEEDGRRR